MKKIFKYIMSATLVVAGMMQFASCNDANDWTVDPSVTKQRPPTSLKVELVDSASLEINVTIGTLANAVSYELQVSESPLSSVEANDAVTVTSEIWEFDGITVDDFQKGKYVLKRENEKFTITQNTTYYFRVRAVGEDGTKSNWYTNGLLYYGSDGDEKIAQILLKNSYNNNSNLNSTSSLTTPSVMWVGNMDIDPDALTINWHETDYATAKYLRNETTGEDRDISNVTPDTNPKTAVWKYKWDGLEVDKEYTFSLLDENKNVIGTFTGKTEFAPVEAISYYLSGALPNRLTTNDPDFIVKGLDSNGNESDLFKGYFTVAKKMKTKWSKDNSQKSSDRAFINPFSGKVFQPLSPMSSWYVSDSKYYHMIQTGGTASNIELTIPAKGRLYIYASDSNGRTISVTQKLKDEESDEEKEVTTTGKLQAAAKFSAGGANFIKTYVEKGTAKVTWSGNIDFCGIHFVPWEAVTSDSNAGQ